MSKEAALAVATGAQLETAPALPQETPPVKEPALDSTRFAALAKREAETVRLREELKREREALLKEKEQLKPIWDRHKTYEETKAKDPVAALKMLGFSETDIINYMAANEKPEPTSEEKAIIAAKEAAESVVKAHEEAQNKKVEDEKRQKDEKIIQGYKSELTKAIESNKEKFEYCSYYGPAAEALAYEFAVAVVQESKGQDSVTPEEAIQMVEEYYEEQDKLMSQLKKRNPAANVETAGRIDPEKPERKVTPGFPNAEQPKPTITKTRTLSNAAASTIAATRQSRNETREEKRERLMSMLRGAKP